MMSKRSLLLVWQYAKNVLISTGKVPNVLFLEHSLVVANAVVS